MKFISLLFFAAFFMNASLSFAQKKDYNPNKNNYLIVSKNIQQLPPILLTAQELSQKDGRKFGELRVVFCGKTVTEFQKKEIVEWFQKAQKAGVKVYVCGLSLKKFNIDATSLDQSVKVVENGITFSFEMQQKKFYVLTI